MLQSTEHVIQGSLNGCPKIITNYNEHGLKQGKGKYKLQQNNKLSCEFQNCVKIVR